MPSKRQRRTRQRRVEVPAKVIALLNDSEPENAVKYFMTDNELRAAWNQIKDELLAGWIEELPGTRPFHWWRFSDPEPRRRLGGIGQPLHEVSAYVENYEYGLLSDWVTSDWRGKGVPIDPQNPPVFESEAAYLRRLGLLLPGEFERLTEADFEPEMIAAGADPEAA